jgi:hypothetical protein
MDRKTRSKITGVLPAALACVCLLLPAGSCSDDKTRTDDTLPVGVVGFRVQGAAPSTRAGSTGAGQVDAVIVNGRMTDGATRGEVLLEGSTLFRLKGTENHFDYSPHAYFPSWAAQASFAAYSPANSRIGAGDFSISPAGSPSDNVISYTLPDPSAGTQPQEDLLVAVAEADKAAFTGPVVLNMRHALSRVHVRARNRMIYPVIIEKLSLHNLYTSGTLDIDGDVWKGGNGTADINDGYSAPVTGHTDYKVLWLPTGSRNGKLSWALARTGAVIPAIQTVEQITADDQAMLVLPQTTLNKDNDAITDPDDFYLEVTYSIQNYGSNTVRCAFKDVNGLPQTAAKEGLTFEMGRQYALTLVFTAEALTLDVSVDEWDQSGEIPEIVNPFLPSWAQSNIYFQPDLTADPGGSIGSLTFSENDASKSGYQGLYFKWGSLIGVESGSGGNDGFGADTHLFIPDVNTGKYYRVKSSEIAADYTDTDAGKQAAVQAYAAVKANMTTWANVPYANELATGMDDTGSSPVTDASKDTYYAQYKGDICKYLSDKKSSNGSGLTRNWVMQVSDKWTRDQTGFPTSGSYILKVKSGGTDDGLGNGNKDDISNLLYYVDDDKGETVIFPTAGYRSLSNGYRFYVGNTGSYWSSSSPLDTNIGYSINFSSGGLSFGEDMFAQRRGNGFTVRCVAE